MIARRIRATLVGIACGAISLVTAATCDPTSNYFDFFRDDDEDYYYDDYYYEDVIYYDDPCYYECY